MLAIALLLMAGLMAAPQTPAANRLSDKQVKALIEQIDHQRDRFEDQLDGDLKDRILRSPTGEVNVSRFLDDLQENVHNLESRFTSEYGAGMETTTLLKQGTTIQRFMATQPPNFKGASEWNALSASLGQLAAAYGTSFPYAEGAPVRRMNDRETAGAAKAMAKAADTYRKSLDQALKADKTVAPASRQAAVGEAETLKKEAETLASRVNDGKPATGEATQLLEHARRIDSAAASLPLGPNVKRDWDAVMKPLETIAQSFGVTAR
jgi:hypothetical protein